MRAVRRDVLDAQRAVARLDHGVLARDEIAVETQRALRVAPDRERTVRRVELRSLHPIV